MYSVMAIFKSSVVWGLFEYTEFFIAPQRKKPGRERSGDLGGQMVLEMILSANTLSKSAIDIRTVLSIAPSCWKQALSISSSFSCAMKGYTVLSQYHRELRVSEKKNGSDHVPTRHSNPNTNLLIMQRQLVEHIGIVCTPDVWVLTVDIPRQMEVCLVCKECDIQIVLSFTVKKVYKPLAVCYPLSPVTRLQFMHSYNFVRV